MKKLTFSILSLLIVGCGAQRMTELMIREVIAPTAAKIAAEASTRNFQLQGQASLINPGVRIRGDVLGGSGAHWDFWIGIEGASTNIAGATQGDQGPDLGHRWPPATQPVGGPK